MKIVALVLFFLIVSCAQEETTSIKEIDYDQSLYQIATPYKKPVVGNYVVHNYLNNYQKRVVERDLMQLARNYFAPDDAYLQGGQLLDKTHLEKLLSDSYLNDTEPMKFDEESYPTNFVISILEYNFLGSNDNLKGVALALVVNPYQAYQLGASDNRYQEVPIEKDFIKATEEKLLDYLHQAFPELADEQIIIGFFELPAPKDRFPGTFTYVSEASADDNQLQKLDYKYRNLASQEVLNKDLENYSLYQDLQKSVDNKFADGRMTGTGLYFNDQPKHLVVDIKVVNVSKLELLYLSEKIAEKVNNSSCPCVIEVIVESKVGLEAVIKSESGIASTKINILRR